MAAIVTTSNVAKLTNEEFDRLSALVYQECGINLPGSKKVMLESRLNKRLRALNLDSFKEYIQLLARTDGVASELIHMIDVVTTNKTDFFREPHHFTFLEQHVLPELIASKNSIKVWSAACSSGEEPYTLAMVLEDFGRLHHNFRYDILASDISTAMLQKAALAIYPMERVALIPTEIKKRYLLKSKDIERPTIRISPQLRKKVRFNRINFMDKIISVKEDFDVIFCRNVLIYFDRKTQSDVILKLVSTLKPGGYLFIGHSESLYQQDLPLVQVNPTIYKKVLTPKKK
jgi:chemotaxis protein methyltransferase CheR